ncbi:nitroreductase family deazaflavin-dependent oxidoreductase [Gordonia alkaliphila]|uniref:nitroreductase family deazaflavin-dependent oxidoreductase n=1 Tax=Gordonia alkaliphila TaxID=1053547 RepID=UPI001FF300C0|nr:nitroreductase family deazaflavin-dependent oxidoreductase [Gordonia alkaliphila]MCK0437938.1 nitroreductase family deazaflavin-dependent oxidoreductase [Gordonia alkaliphila]
MASRASKMLHTRWLVRAPIPLFRAGLGFVFGGRLLLLEHLGRTSGEHRFVVLECVERPAKHRVVVASGFGETSQWYANLQADPHCWVSIGFARRRPAIARTLPPEVAEGVIERYRVAHPKAYDELAGVIEESIGSPLEAIPYVELILT